MGSKRVWLPVLLAVSCGMGACTTPGDRIGMVRSSPVSLDAYSWLDRADILLDAIENSPPDYSFEHAGAQLFAWEVDGALIIEEPSPDGYSLYIYEAGQRLPMFVRTPDFAAGFDRDELAVIYTRDGRVFTDDFQSDLFHAAWALRERGGTLFGQNYAGHWDLDVAEAWASIEFVIDSHRRRWSDRWRQDRNWQDYRRRSEADAGRAALRAERQRRRQQGQLFRTWRDSGFAGPPPSGLARRDRDGRTGRESGNWRDRPAQQDGGRRPGRPGDDLNGPGRPPVDVDGVRPDRPRRDGEGTRPDRPRRDDSGTRPDRPGRDDGATTPPPANEGASRPDRPRRDDSGTRPDRPRQGGGGTSGPERPPARPAQNPAPPPPVTTNRPQPAEPNRPAPIAPVDADRPADPPPEREAERRRARIDRPAQPADSSATVPASAIEEEAARRREENVRRREREEVEQRDRAAARQAEAAEADRQAREAAAVEDRRLRAEEAQLEAQAEQMRQAGEEAARRVQEAQEEAAAQAARQQQAAAEAERQRQAAAEAEAARQRQAAADAAAAAAAAAAAEERRRVEEAEDNERQRREALRPTDEPR